jgi:peptide/nickel transport system ATP-binding protein
MVEHGSVKQVIESPRHPYTRGLIDSVPDVRARGRRLRQIPGHIASAAADLPGCAFAPRCERVQDTCRVDPPFEPQGDGRRLRCWTPVP